MRPHGVRLRPARSVRPPRRIRFENQLAARPVDGLERRRGGAMHRRRFALAAVLLVVDSRWRVRRGRRRRRGGAAETTETGGGGGGGGTLQGSVGPGFEISLEGTNGLTAGDYTLVVNDQSSNHNFHLTGPGGVDVSTEVERRARRPSTSRSSQGGSCATRQLDERQLHRELNRLARDARAEPLCSTPWSRRSSSSRNLGSAALVQRPGGHAERAAADAAPRHRRARRPRRPPALFPMELILQEVGEARDRDPGRGARHLPAVAADAAVPRPAPRGRRRHAVEDLLQVRGVSPPEATSRTRRSRRPTTTSRTGAGASRPRRARGSGAARSRLRASSSASSARSTWSGSRTTRSRFAGR